MVQINVTDLEAAWHFYVDILGMPGIRRLGPNKAFELQVAAQIVVLVYPVTIRRRMAYPDETGPLLVFSTADIVATVQNWKSRGVKFIPIAWSTTGDGIAFAPYGRFIAFEDPAGNVHELLEPR